MIDGLVLLEPPTTTMAAGAAHPVPVLLGSNADEGTLFVWLAGLSDIDEATYTTMLTDAAPALGTDAATLLAQYPAASYSSPGAALSALVGHAGFNCPTRRIACYLSAAGMDTYLYHFVHVPSFNLVQGLGSFHAADVGLLFGTDYLGLVPMGSGDQALSAAMMGYWSRFGATGDPNGTAAVAWPTYDAASDQHLTFDTDTIAVGSHLLETECDFWDGLAGG